MTWIALKMLTGDKPKFFGIVMGLTFAALLITQQGSIFCGLMLRTAAQITDITGVDLWVMDPSVRFIDDTKPMLESNLYRVRGVDGVRWAVPLYKGNARAKLTPLGPAGKPVNVIEQVILLGLDDVSMVGAPPPERILAGKLIDLRQTDAVIVDRVGLRKLFPALKGQVPPHPDELIGKFEADGVTPKKDILPSFIGQELEMNDHRAVIVGICEATRTFQSNPVVYTTYTRAKSFVPRERKLLSYVLVQVEPGQDPTKVAENIRARTSLGAMSSDEFQMLTINYYLKYTGIPINFGITVFLGFLVGTAIAGQTFYNFTLENIKQFGALKAMGTTNTRIVGMVLVQAAVVGLLGYGIGTGGAAIFGQRVQGTELAFFTWWPVLPIAGGAVVLICLLSSLISVRRVIVLEPAIVFRG